MRKEIMASMKEAMKSGDKIRLSTIRLIQAAIKDRDIASRAKTDEPITDEEIMELLAKMVKQRNESSAQYNEAGRPELAEREEAEIVVISGFMPEQLGEEAVAEAVQSAIATSGAESVRDMGKVMATLKSEFAGQMDFSKASAMVKDVLNS